MHRDRIFTKDFTLVAVGQIISLFGNQMLRYALPLYLLKQTGSAVLFGTVMAFSAVPMILLYPVGGILADRVNKRNIMVALDLCTAALIAVFCLLLGRVDIVPLMAATMIVLYGIQGAYQPAVKASVPLLAKDMMQGNAVVDMISSLAGMVGPAVGGVLYSAIGLEPILYLSTGCFFASAAMELFIHIPHEKRQVERGILATGIDDLGQSFRFMFKTQPVLWKLALLLACVNLLLTSLVLIGVPVLVAGHLGFGAQVADRLYGYSQGAIALGAVLGGILAGAFSKRLSLKAGPYLLAGCAASMLLAGAGLHLFVGAMARYLLLVSGCGLLIAVSTVFQIQMMTQLQVLTPRELTGKVIASVMCVCMCTSPVGQFVYGMVFEWVGGCVYLPFYGAAVAMLAISARARHMFAQARPLAGQKNVAEPAAGR